METVPLTGVLAFLRWRRRVASTNGKIKALTRLLFEITPRLSAVLHAYEAL
jgi:hypothetical protein